MRALAYEAKWLAFERGEEAGSVRQTPRFLQARRVASPMRPGPHSRAHPPGQADSRDCLRVKRDQGVNSSLKQVPSPATTPQTLDNCPDFVLYRNIERSWLNVPPRHRNFINPIVRPV